MCELNRAQTPTSLTYLIHCRETGWMFQKSPTVVVPLLHPGFLYELLHMMVGNYKSYLK